MSHDKLLPQDHEDDQEQQGLSLEDLKRGARVIGIDTGGVVTIIDATWHGDDVLEIAYRDSDNRLGETILYRDSVGSLSLADGGKVWSFDGDGGTFRLTAEALRIRNAHLFDPFLAVTTSLVEPLPHQIMAVYGDLVPRQPLRFLLADDPGAGKTIMAGLLMRELQVRGDLERCMVVCPGALADQWQDELWDKFNLDFEIITRQDFEAARGGNPFLRKPLVICRLDQLSRNEEIQVHLQHPELHWDLVVIDEAHKMSAHYWGNELKKTKRFRLGEFLGEITRHFLLMTATPHNGKEADFQLFLGLLDSDRFAGKYREGAHQGDTSDLMRRMIKEDMFWPDGRRLFPERRAYTVAYRLSQPEADLYEAVTTYVREEMNRAERFAEEQGGKARRNIVGFALTTLQRRLASSPHAIHRSLERRRDRLNRRLQDLKTLGSGTPAADKALAALKALNIDLPDFDDREDLPEDELFNLAELVLDQATAAGTITELEAEISTLHVLESLASEVKKRGIDSKWRELSSLLQDESHMFDSEGLRRKLIIFTEHRDTLNYLESKVQALLGRPEAVVTIRGGMARQERRRVQELFLQDKDVHILIATDAAGEGVNLQRAHLMVNYDLPWNPNRLEQRFGRIHRIGQEEVCHCWNLVAEETREGEVYLRLFTKLQAEREALDGKVFDVLGKAFSETPLRDLMLEAIRYGDDPEVKARQRQIIEDAVDRERLNRLLDEDAIIHDVLDPAKIQEIRVEMDRAQARRLQPHFIASFFLEAFKRLGGRIHEREPKRFEVTRVPSVLRSRDRLIGGGAPVLQRYERVTFHKDLMSIAGQPTAQFLTPGHPLLSAVIDLTLDQMKDVLRRGAVLVDDGDDGHEVRVLAYLEHSIRDARTTATGDPRVVSRRLQCIETNAEGSLRPAGPAPHLDYRPITENERNTVNAALDDDWLGGDVEKRCRSYAVSQLAPQHLAETKTDIGERVERTIRAVRERLTSEITFWDRRAEDLRAQEQAGKSPRRSWQKARRTEEELTNRLELRLLDLEKQRNFSALPPRILGGAVVVPKGLLQAIQEGGAVTPGQSAEGRDRVERLAVDAVMAAERTLGREPKEMPHNNPGYDIESYDPGSGRLHFLEVKGRVAGATTVTITRTEILTALNAPDRWILALVNIENDQASEPRYLMQPFTKEPDFNATSVNFKLKKLQSKAVPPFECRLEV